MNWPYLLVIDCRTKGVNRYEGREITHKATVVGGVWSKAKLENFRRHPDKAQDAPPESEETCA